MLKNAALPCGSSSTEWANRPPRAMRQGRRSSKTLTTCSCSSRKTASIANRMKNMWMLGHGVIHSPSLAGREARPSRPRMRLHRESVLTSRGVTTSPRRRTWSCPEPRWSGATRSPGVGTGVDVASSCVDHACMGVLPRVTSKVGLPHRADTEAATGPETPFPARSCATPLAPVTQVCERSARATTDL